MFSAEEFQARLREKPFRPFRIIASEDQRFEIRHPEMVMVGRRDLAIGVPHSANATVYDRLIRIALVHVVAMEDLPSAPTTGNGQ